MGETKPTTPPMPRRYGKWAGNPQGVPEDATLCIEYLFEAASWRYIQCGRKRGFGPDGLYCKEHAQSNWFVN